MDTEQLLLALEHLNTALQLLDQIGAPPHIGAHVDLAIHQLEGAFQSDGSQIVRQPIETNAEPQ